MVKDINVNLKQNFQKLIKYKITSMRRYSFGRNSRSYLIGCGNKLRYFGKVYYSDAKDHRERLKNEYQSLVYLWDNDIRVIPKPIAYDNNENIAIYEFVEGRKIDPKEIKKEHLDQTLTFIYKLCFLSKKTDKSRFPDAAEACFSFKALTENIRQRLERLSQSTVSSPLKNDLDDFLEEKFIPYYKKALHGRIKSIDQTLPQKYRLLSPSDIGFHNILEKKNGQLIFLDFEYFGWDDPVKLASDFLAHPKTFDSQVLKEYFIQKMASIAKDDYDFLTRFAVCYPLYALKWCLIMLNEFLPENYLRRVFALKNKMERKNTCRRQLKKANAFFEKLKCSKLHQGLWINAPKT